MEYLKMNQKKTKTKIRDICYDITESYNAFVGIKYLENEVKIYFPL